ncbi:winged helix DNA-binding domain-containing protein [Microbacterium lacus]|uniref:winged helix DNA-binding domain-containing protein n=1 Tax=Microbacterium lacus TaxID=415217 RepID=UPI00384C27E7
MNIGEFRARRLRSHRLSAPAASVIETARHMLATQGQEFWGGRLALAARTTREPTLSEVDGAFERSGLVRSWTMRGTIHVIPADELGWVLGLTGERQHRGAASIHRREGLDAEAFAVAEQVAVSALAGGNRLSRRELFDAFDRGGLSTAGQRGYHLLVALSVRGLICQGPVVPREEGPTREQFFVLTDEWVDAPVHPADPLAEFFVRYMLSHGPAGTADFAWWSGLPIGTARRAAAAAASDSRLTRLDDDLWVATDLPRRHPSASVVIALPPFEEYFLSYADRSVSVPPHHSPAVMTGGAGYPILLARGEVVATWSHSHALARRHLPPTAKWIVEGAVSEAEATAALERYRRFIEG